MQKGLSFPLTIYLMFYEPEIEMLNMNYYHHIEWWVLSTHVQSIMCIRYIWTTMECAPIRTNGSNSQRKSVKTSATHNMPNKLSPKNHSFTYTLLPISFICISRLKGKNRCIIHFWENIFNVKSNILQFEPFSIWKK